MATSINAILNMGAGALFANQAAIQTTGNNIANVNTTGYSRQVVRFEEYPSLDYRPGQIGQGVRAAEVYRMFDRFVEKAYLNKASLDSRWQEQSGLLQGVETLFNEANSPGIASAMQKFFNAWQDLSKDATSSANREALLSFASTFASFVQDTDASMLSMQNQMSALISQDVTNANNLIKDIAALNIQINAHSIPGSNNPNTLMDQRDLKVRQLSEIIDVDVIDRGEGHYTVTTSSGQPLVEEGVAYSLAFLGPRTSANLMPGSTFDGQVAYAGSDEHEYTLDVVTGGAVDGGAMFRASLDGGRTWLKDANGNDMLFPANSESGKVQVNGIEVYFNGATQNMTVGDKFHIMPKSGLYWVSPTTGLSNITPQTFADGTENSRRVTGGSLAAYFDFRDNQLGEYRDRLDAFAGSVAWEVNRIHSQGVGLEKLTTALGTYKVADTTVPLGSNISGLTFGDRLQAGNVTIAMYDRTTGQPTLLPDGTQSLLTINFDPATDSLDDLAAQINGGGLLTAGIVDGRLQLTSADPTQSFAFTADTSGVLAGLGINTFFSGDHANNIAVRAEVLSNTNLINAARVNGGAEGNSGDSATALAIAQLANKAVSIGTGTQKATSQTLVGYYATIVAKVGGDTAAAKYNGALYGAMAQDLRDRQDEISGVNLDEEMTNLVKFQNSYKAAAKLITTADQMLQTLLSLKQ